MKIKIWFHRNFIKEGLRDVVILSRTRPKMDEPGGVFDLTGKQERCVILALDECKLLFGSPIVRPGCAVQLDLELSHEE